MSSAPLPDTPLASALRTLSLERQGVEALEGALSAPGEDSLGAALTRAVEAIAASAKTLGVANTNRPSST